MNFRGFAYRGIDPRWSFSPTSGEGAAIHGGRFNPRGVPALYLSTSPEGAILEASHGFGFRFPPLTLCTYDIDCENVVDLTSVEERAKVGITLENMACAWAADASEGRRPASWSVHDTLHSKAAGLLVPSLAIGATGGLSNLVLWDWSAELPHRVTVFDPDNRLPRNDESWRT